MYNIIKIIIISLFYVAIADAAIYENWNSGEPNDSGTCGWMYGNGTWDDSNCTEREPTLCYDGNVWSLGVPESIIIFGIINTSPVDQCRNLGEGYLYTAPFNDYENERARKVLAESEYSRARINLHQSGSNWLSNVTPYVPFITRWFGEDANQLDEPDNGKDASGAGNEDCVAMDRNGFWHDEDCSKSFRFICADQGSFWSISGVADSQKDLYSGETACRNTSKRYTFEAAGNDSDNLDVVNVLANSYASSATYGDKFWVNVNDRLTEGTYLNNENRYFWLKRDPAANSEPNNSGDEDCVERSGSDWNDVGCSSDTQKFACFHYGTGQWRDSTATSNKGDDVVSGAAACQALGPFWTFWAPHTPSQNAGAASDDTWFNINDSATEGVWQANRQAYFWGKTDFSNRDDAGFYSPAGTLMQPNDGDGNNGTGSPTSYDRRTPELNIGSNEDCAVQLKDGSWHDLPCSNAQNFACYSSEFDNDANDDTKPWRLASGSVNSGLYRGETLCQALDSSRSYHFVAPNDRQQQADLSALISSASWINATDRSIEGTWQYNTYLMFWAANQPEATVNKNCAVMDTAQDSRWFAESCSNNHSYLCYDEANDDWSLAAADSIDSTNGIEACLAHTLNSATWKFSAPDSFLKLAAVKSDPQVINQGKMWVNASDQQKEGDWKYNQQRFWDYANNEPNGGVAQSCAVMKAADSLWDSESCTGPSRPYLCFNTTDESWRLSTATGNMANFGAGQNACEQLNTLVDDYLFYAPSYQWENDAAKIAMGSTDAWINANDRIVEGDWAYNEFLYWSAGSPDSTGSNTNDCLVMNEFGHWDDVDCSSEARKVACYSGDGWYVTTEMISLANYSNAQQACNNIGEGYRFYAPTYPENNRELRALLSTGESIWINGIDIAEEGEWVFNSKGLPTPNWAKGQPDAEVAGNCAYVDQNGLWYDAACSESKSVACINGDGSYRILSAGMAIGNNFDSIQQACRNAGAESFYAPITFNENEQLREALSAGQEVWVNVSDALIEARWALNIASTANLASSTINADLNTTSGITDGCVSLNASGGLTSPNCNQAKSVACYNGQEWRVSNNQVVLGETATDGKLIRNAFAICQQEFSGDFTFATPENTDVQGKWELAQALALSGQSEVWLNLADWYVANSFSANMPYQNLATSVTSNTGCAYVDSNTDGWLVAEVCDEKEAHYACYDGSVWQLALADGTIDEPGIPQSGVDTWDQSRADLRCRELFGQSYSFSAPLNPREDTRLQLEIKQSPTENKDVWINYYANRMWNGLKGQQWFNDRINIQILDDVKIDQESTTEDCASLHNSASGLVLQDDTCSDTSRALCFNGINWKLSTAEVQWNQASSACGEEFDEEHIFAIPRDSQEREAVIAELMSNAAVEELVWVNYSDLAVESKWRANLPLRQWWADSEPTNRGNRDCVVMDGAGTSAGTWRSDYCDQVFHHFACKNGSQWQITNDKGIWAQGFSKCHELGDGWHFDYPEDYFANLNAATTLSGETVPQDDFDNGDIQLPGANLAGRSAWLNLTDQYREKDWQRGRQFSDWAANFAFDDNKDCAFVDTQTTEINGESVKGSWQPGYCHASDTARQFACTNGLSWVVTTTTSTNWSAGFDACAALNPAGTWEFAAPVTVFDNQRLKIAIGNGSAWINLQDVGNDGDWAANLIKPNLPPVIKFVEEDKDNNINELLVVEKGSTTAATLTNLINVQVVDPEGSAALKVEIEEVNNNAVITTPLELTKNCGSAFCDFSFSYNTPFVANSIKELSFKLTATDDDNNVTTTYFNAEVVPAIIAWYDFNDANRTNYDKTGNGNDANDSPSLPYDFPPVKNGALEFTSGLEQMTVNGTKLAMPANYAVAMRIWADGEDDAEYQQFQIKFSGTNQCFDLPGQGAGAATDGANIAMYTCEDASDQYWFKDEAGLIRSVANNDLCISHPGDGNALSSNARNIVLSYCSNVQHPWTIAGEASAAGGAIESVMHSGYFLYASSSNNNTNVVLANTAPRTWVTEKNIGRGILQKGPASNQPLLTFAEKTSHITYTIGNQSATTADAIAEEQWVNLVINVENNLSTLYVDGVADANAINLSVAPGANTDDLIVGDIPSALRSFIGRVDDVQVYSRPLSLSEVVDVLPVPPIGVAQFETDVITRQEPQAEGLALLSPVIVKRTDGSRGQLQVSVKSLVGTAKEGDSQILGVDYLKLESGDQLLTWKPDDTPLNLSPEYGLFPLLGAKPPENIDSVEFDAGQPIFAAIDLSIGSQPRGIVWEQGGSGRGTLVAFDETHQLIVRAGNGQAGATTDTARLVVSASAVSSNLANKSGTLLVEINPIAGTVHAWFKEGGLLGDKAIVDLGSATASAGFASGEWQGGNPGRLGNINSDVVRGENFNTPFTTFNARYIRNSISGNSVNENVHWVELQAFNASGTNLALNKTVTSIPGETVISGRPLSRLVDNDLDAANYTELGTATGNIRWMQVDLGAAYDISYVNLRHYYADGRSYKNNKTEYSLTGADGSWTTLADFTGNDYAETSAGQNMDLGVDESSYVYNNTISMARFYNQVAPSPIERVLSNAKLLGVTLYNEATFTREPVETFGLQIVDSQSRTTDSDSWVAYPEGETGFINQAEVRLRDYTKNPFGILQLSAANYECSEPHAGDRTGTADYNGENRSYRYCSVEVQRLTGDLNTISVQYGISSTGLEYTAAGAAVTPTTDVLFATANQKLTFAPGVRTQSIGFSVLAEVGVNDIFENNETFRITLFNPLNEDNASPNSQPWLGEPTQAVIRVEDYAVGRVQMEKSKATFEEPLFDSLDASNNFVIETVGIERSNGSNGTAEVSVSLSNEAQDTLNAGDYEFVDVDGNPQALPVTLSWSDGQQSVKNVFIKIKADLFEEYRSQTQNTEATEPCYDVRNNQTGAAGGDGISDDLDRNCYVGESLRLVVAKTGGDANLGDVTSTRVFVNDNTAPAVLNFTSQTKALDTVSEVVTANTVDANNNGVFDDGDVVSDRRINLSVQRSNQYAEHAVWLYVRGVDDSPAIAADFQGINTFDTSDSFDRSSYDAGIASRWIRSSGVAGEWRYLWKMPMSTGTESQITNSPGLTMDTDITSWVGSQNKDVNLAAIVDGNKSTSGTDDYQIHPSNADGKFISFDWSGIYQGGRVVYYNRVGCCGDRIDGSTVEFSLDNVVVHQYIIPNNADVGGEVTINIPGAIQFDQIKFIFSGASQNFREIEVFSTSLPDSAQTHDLDVVILDNDRENLINRNVEFRIEPAGNRDHRVIHLGDLITEGESAAEFADIQITDQNLPPAWSSTSSSVTHTYNMPIRAGGSMKLDSRVQFGTNVATGNRIRAFDPDWVTMDYQVAKGSGAFKASNRTTDGGYLSWDRGMLETWDFTTPGTSTSDNYTYTINIKAEDSEGVVLTTSANLSMNLVWRQIRLANSDECIFRTGGTIEWDYFISDNCANQDRYYWAAIPVDGVADAYQLINKETRTCLFKNNNSNGNAGFRTCVGGDEEHWYFDRNGSGSQTIQRWDSDRNVWQYLCGNIGDSIDIKNGGTCSWSNARWK